MSQSASASTPGFLANAAVNLVALREHARKELVKILESIPGKKALVLDQQLSGPLGLIAEVDLLKKHGIDQIYHLLNQPLVTDCPNIIYMVRPHVKTMKWIAEQVLHLKRVDNIKRTFNVQFVPRKTMLCERMLMEQGVYGDLVTGEFQLELIPFDDDVLSLEMKHAFREVFLDGDPTVLYYIAKSIMKLQSIFGIIPTIKGKGDNAHRVYNLITRMRRESGYSNSALNNTIPEIDQLILIDRSVDMVSPLLTQLTYEGLIDEVFGIKNGYIDVDAELVDANRRAGAAGPGGAPPAATAAASSAAPAKKKLQLNSVDTLFKEIRDMHFRAGLGPVLRKKLANVDETYRERHQAVTVNDMANFMRKFKTANREHTLLQIHVNLAEKISQFTKTKQFDRRLEVEQWLLDGTNQQQCEDYLEECIAKQEPFLKVVRLLCLMSLTQGIRDKKYAFLKRELIQTYGYEQMFTLDNLESLGLFNKQVKKTNWPAIKKALRLFTPKDKVELAVPNDIAYTFDGYAPLSVRLIEVATKPGWKRLEEVMNLLPGKTFEAKQELPQSVLDRRAFQPQAAEAKQDGSAAPKDAATANSPTVKKPLTLVYFIGGITFAEIAALRHLSERENHGRDYLIAATKLINGSTILKTVQETIVNNLDKSTIRPLK